MRRCKAKKTASGSSAGSADSERAAAARSQSVSVSASSSGQAGAGKPTLQADYAHAVAHSPCLKPQMEHHTHAPLRRHLGDTPRSEAKQARPHPHQQRHQQRRPPRMPEQPQRRRNVLAAGHWRCRTHAKLCWLDTLYAQHQVRRERLPAAAPPAAPNARKPGQPRRAERQQRRARMLPCYMQGFRCGA